MATDLRAIIAELTAFYDFAGKRVLHVGAGGEIVQTRIAALAAQSDIKIPMPYALALIRQNRDPHA